MSALMKTAFDPAYEDVAGDARHALHRCTTDAEFARWAKIWGNPLCEALLDDESAARADLAEEEATKAEAALDRLGEFVIDICQQIENAPEITEALVLEKLDVLQDRVAIECPV